MYKVALSTAVAVYRKKAPPVLFLGELPDRSDNLTHKDDQSDQLLEALKTLDDGDKALIVLYLEDLSYKEIAELSGISENNVGVKLNVKGRLAEFTSG
jgi:RNA polymerase sigma factor (sigma-70 family)